MTDGQLESVGVAGEKAAAADIPKNRIATNIVLIPGFHLQVFSLFFVRPVCQTCTIPGTEICHVNVHFVLPLGTIAVVHLDSNPT